MIRILTIIAPTAQDFLSDFWNPLIEKIKAPREMNIDNISASGLLNVRTLHIIETPFRIKLNCVKLLPCFNTMLFFFIFKGFWWNHKCFVFFKCFYREWCSRSVRYAQLSRSHERFMVMSWISEGFGNFSYS